LIREAIRRRYALLPYWYTLFYEHSLTGKPVMRPLWMEFPTDENGFDEEREWLVGAALLIRPVFEPDVTSVSLYLPGRKQMWYEWDTHQIRPGPGAVYVDTPLSKIPVFQRGGTIIPLRQRVRRASTLQRNDPITLYVAPSMTTTEYANGTLYLDDGESYNYKQGQYLYWAFEYKKVNDFLYSISNKNLDKKGTLETEVFIEQVVVRGARYYPRNVHIYLDDYTPDDLEFTHDRETHVLIIRKPAALVSKEFRIDIHM